MNSCLVYCFSFVMIICILLNLMLILLFLTVHQHDINNRELPRVLMIYDIDMPVEKAKKTIRDRFYDNKDIKDHRVQEMLIETGYFQLETSMLQHKQKNHLMHFLEGYTVPMEAARKRLSPDSSIEEQFARN